VNSLSLNNIFKIDATIFLIIEECNGAMPEEGRTVPIHKPGWKLIKQKSAD
jgi:hypothetical protein